MRNERRGCPDVSLFNILFDGLSNANDIQGAESSILLFLGSDESNSKNNELNESCNNFWLERQKDFEREEMNDSMELKSDIDSASVYRKWFRGFPVLL